MKKIIRYSPEEIKSIAAGNDLEAWKKLRDEFGALRDLFNKERDSRDVRLMAEKKKAHKDELRKLPKESDVYYIYNSSEIKYGTKGTKMKDGTKYMTVIFNNKSWWVPYSHLSINAPSESTIKVNRGIANIFLA